jgi:hypothetical protein
MANKFANLDTFCADLGFNYVSLEACFEMERILTTGLMMPPPAVVREYREFKADLRKLLAPVQAPAEEIDEAGVIEEAEFKRLSFGAAPYKFLNKAVRS